MSRSIHTYRADSIDEAFRLVRDQFGVDAVVVDSREIPHGHFFPWTARHREFEMLVERRPIESNQSTTIAHDIRTLAEKRFLKRLTIDVTTIRPCIEHVNGMTKSGIDETTSSFISSHSCHSIAVYGGKGGVGRSVIALNLAVSLAQQGARVGLIDASSSLGNIELLSGLNGYWNLEHVMQGCRRLDEVVLPGPAGIEILTGASNLFGHQSDIAPNDLSIFQQLTQFERNLDWLVVDASGTTSTLSRCFAGIADDVLVVTVPEATAIAESYATVKSFASGKGPRLGMIVNRANSAAQANQILDRVQQTARSFLQVDLHRRGYVPNDSAISASVNSRRPFVLNSPTSPATLAMQELAQRWTRIQKSNDCASYFSRLEEYQDKIRSEVLLRT